MTSRVQRCAAKVVLVATALTLGACSQYGVANRAISVNKGLESANNRMLLLNAVRASKRYPMVFSEVTKIDTSDPVSGSIGLNVPFGGDAASTFVLTPSIDLDSGTQMSIAPLDKQKFTRGITTPTSLKTLNYYLRQGWPPEMLFHMFIRTMRFEGDSILNAIDFDPKEYEEKNGIWVYVNAPGSKTQRDFKRFQELLRKLLESPYFLDVRTRKEELKPDGKKTTLVTTSGPKKCGRRANARYRESGPHHEVTGPHRNAG